jgi:hypothetical protein
MEMNNKKNNDLLKIKMYLIRQQRALKNVSNEARPTCLQVKNKKFLQKITLCYLKQTKKFPLQKCLQIQHKEKGKSERK